MRTIHEAVDDHFFQGRASVWDRKDKKFRSSASRMERAPPKNGITLTYEYGRSNGRAYSMLDNITGFAEEDRERAMGALDHHDIIYWVRKQGKQFNFRFMQNIVRDYGYQLEE